jgi:2'-5' RNA ligase
MSETLRTFIAVEVPLEVRDKARRVIAALDTTPAKVKWVEPANLHWTLKFLGEVELVETPAICEAVSRAVEPLASFDVETFGVGAFPDRHRPRTVWLGMRHGSEAMIELHDAI